MPRRRAGLAALLALLAGAAPARAWGQTSGSVQVTGTVLPAITISGTDLRFGNMLPTGSKTVAPALGGTFTLTMSANAPVSITYQLPSTLGPNVTIGSWNALYNTANNTGSAVAVPISSTTGTYVTSTPSGAIYLWFGATLTTAGAAPGTYSAPIRLTVAYD